MDPPLPAAIDAGRAPPTATATATADNGREIAMSAPPRCPKAPGSATRTTGPASSTSGHRNSSSNSSSIVQAVQELLTRRRRPAPTDSRSAPASATAARASPSPSRKGNDDDQGDVVSMTLVHLLEPIDLEMHTTSRGAHDDVRYVLTVHQRQARAMWRHPRSFDEYEAFHERIVRALHPGHPCRGDCPWLQGFLDSALNPSTWFVFSGTLHSVIERRKRTLLQILEAIQTFLRNRLNHACPFVTEHVAVQFLEFIYGNVVDNHHILERCLDAALAAAVNEHQHPGHHRRSSHSHSISPTRISECAPSDSSGSASTPTTEGAGVGGGERTCPLCAEALPVKDVYVMRLTCGHRFHDECLLPKLNEALRCPTCGRSQV